MHKSGSCFTGIAAFAKRARQVTCFGCCILLSFACCQFVGAQLKPSYLFKFDKISTGERPFNQSILCIMQDAVGFMWFGTSSGIYNYDGNTLQRFAFDELRDAEIDCLLEDSNRNIWIATAWQQLFKYDELHNTLTHYVYDSAGLSHSTNTTSIITMCAGKNNSLWLATRKGILSLNTITGKFTKYSGTPGAGICMFRDTIWAGTAGKGIQCLDAVTGRLLKIPARWAFFNDQCFTVTSIYADKTANLWVGTSEGLFLQTANSQVKRFVKGTASSLPDNYIVSILQDKDAGFTWVSTGKGIALYEDAKNGFVPFINNGDVNYSAITGAYGNCIYKDAGGKIWVGTTGAGIYAFYPRKIKVYRHIDDGTSASLHSSNLKGVFLLKNKFLLAVSQDGVDVVNTENGGCSFYRFNNTINPLQNNIQFPAERDDESIFIGGNTGLFTFNVLTHKYSQALPEKYNRRFAKVNTAIYDHGHNLWIGCESGGLYEYLPAYDSLRQFTQGRRGLESDNINRLDIDKGGNIVVSNYNGIQKHFPSSDTFYFTSKNNETFLTTAGMCFLNGGDSIGIAGTYQQGIFLVDSRLNIRGNIDEEKGLGSNTILSLAQAKPNSIWVTTNLGINKVDFENNNFTGAYHIFHFDHSDGLPGEQVFKMASRTVNGKQTWYLATNDGLAEIDEENFAGNTIKPPVFITGLQVSGKLISPLDSSHILALPVYLTKQLNLSYTQNSFQLTFAGLNYINSQKNEYAYMLKGADKNWVYTKNTTSVSYSGLGPGQYTFLVKAANDAGVWNEVPAQLTLVISPPFWETIWAYLLYAIAAAAIVLGIYRNRINNYKKKQDKQLRSMIATQEAERKRISRDLHDDIGTKLSALKLFVSAFKINLQKQQYHETELLASSTEQLIDETIKDVREMLMNLSPGILEEFGYATAVEGLVNKINETGLFNIRLVIFSFTRRMAKDYELALYRITQELINNILKHSGAKHVSLQAGSRDGKVILMIEDDGKGFDVTANREGYGLKNMEARVTLLKGTLQIDSQPGKGASILIEIPYQFK